MKFLFDHDVPAVLEHAWQNGLLLVTCNRDDFVNLAAERPHHGIIVVFRRKSRTAEKAPLLRLIESAGPDGLANNINFA